ncbi:hypothetical protein ACHAXT_008552 [Thalassiosira profunda]
MSGIDYSKWNNLNVSDSEESDEGDAYDGEMPSFSGGVSSFPDARTPPRCSVPSDAGPAERSLISRGKLYKKDPLDGWLVLPNGIRVHPEDKKMNIASDVLLDEDPRTFVPDGSERVRKWGLKQSDDSWGGIMGLMAGSDNQFLYKNFDTGRGESANDKDDPEEQFINVLIDRKNDYIESKAVQSAMNKTFILRVELVECEKYVWRRVKVPSGIDLSKLHDQVICPVMGWSRGYHTYAFEDPKDGTAIGPTKYTGGIDSMHIPMHYIKLMDDRHVPLAALVRQKGDVAYYVYDLGDHWEHRLILEEVVDDEETVTLINGAGACPPEDSNGLTGMGCSSYREFLDEYKKNPHKAKIKKVVNEASRSSNYASPWDGGQPLKLKPLHFDIVHHRRLLKLMLAGPSVKKRFVHMPTATRDEHYRESTKGCTGCGSRLKALSKCTGCRKASYCTRQCQLDDWKNHKALCRKEQKKAKKGRKQEESK